MQTNTSRGRMLALVVLTLGLQACSSPKSSSTSGAGGGPVPTSQMELALTVESKESGVAVVRANISDGKTVATSYRLDGGDFLRACVAGLCRPMADNDSVYTPDYIARFDYQQNIDYVVSFNRQAGANAPDSRVALPPTFTIVTPANHQQVTDGETVIVEWAPTGAPALASATYEADCTFPGGTHAFGVGSRNDIDGNGRESFEIDDIVDFSTIKPGQRATSCSIDFVVRHELRGRVDPAFRKGVAAGIVSREVNVAYLPR
jgi:hypothetical protein